ncbi:uncharacterized protein LOC141670758 [Apium graveolens]|uniref:uncharacterized protein LOC141670758 n=1 Tax=Apium graveolens TaxID=4045 RepID=UPI003D79BD61
MDSGNSGSMQSSGGEEDYDPRAAADSSFNPIYNHFSPPPPTIYDPTTNLSNFYNPPLTNSFYTSQSQTLAFHPHTYKQNQTPKPQNEPTRVQLSQSQPSQTPNDQDQTTQGPRNPKKRSRASRRAPTTVLTTDTSNFRAMVQEFTGIPAPPFMQSSSFPRSRLDLFSTPSSIRSNISITQTPSSYHTLLLRPLPQKLQLPRSSSSFFEDANNNNPLIFSNSSELGFLKHQQLMQPQMQNPNQSNFLQSNLKFSNSSIFGSKTGQDFSLGMPSQSNLKINALEEFGLSYNQINNAQVPGLPDLISPENRNNFVTNEKQNNHPATNFHDGKRTRDDVSSSATRGTSEGIMEPWICSSD